MDKIVARRLQDEAEVAAQRFSSPKRTLNYTAEEFTVDEIIPLSAQAACVIFKKSSGKKAVAHFIYVQSPKPYWTYYFLGAEHLINLDKIPDIYWDVERFNYPLNFPVEETE
tara:strand:+ start:1161 stop:1496 length:336 start_codon:yes stop_codon:yes gene_type:complete